MSGFPSWWRKPQAGVGSQGSPPDVAAGLVPAVFCSLALVAVAAAEPEKPKPPPPQPPALGRFEVGSGQGLRIDAVVPGPIVAALVPPADEGPRSVLLLVRPEGEIDGPRSLYRLEPRPGGGLVELASGLPGGAKAMFTGDLDGDGEAELLLGGMGELDTLGPLARLAERPTARPLLRHPGFDPRSLSPRLLRIADAPGAWMGSPLLAAAEAGALRIYEPGQPEPRLRAKVPLPLTVQRETTGFRLDSPRVTLLASGQSAGSAAGNGASGDHSAPAGGGPSGARFAAGPEAHGDRRLRTVLVELPAEGPAVTTETWSRLPAPEIVEASRYAVIGGKTILIALTQSAGKLAIFENRKLRVFSLVEDRTRIGKLPLLTYDTDSPRWDEPDIHVTDATGDGKEDLVLLYAKGLASPELGLELLPGLGGGRFSTQVRRSALEPVPSAWTYGHDLTGDGRPDLVTLGKDSVAVYAGSTASGRVIDKKPLWTLPLRKPEEDPREVLVALSASGAEVDSDTREQDEEIEVVDLDGDGRLEIVVLSPDVVGRGVVRVVRLPKE